MERKGLEALKFRVIDTRLQIEIRGRLRKILDRALVFVAAEFGPVFDQVRLLNG